MFALFSFYLNSYVYRHFTHETRWKCREVWGKRAWAMVFCLTEVRTLEVRSLNYNKILFPWYARRYPDQNCLFVFFAVFDLAVDYIYFNSDSQSRWGRDSPPVQTGPGAHPASCKMGTRSFPGVKCGRGVLLTTHPLLVPRPWKSRAIPLPTLWATPGL